MTVYEYMGSTGVVIVRNGGVSGQVSVTLISTISSSIRGNRLQKAVTFADGVDNATVLVNIRSSSAYGTRRFVLTLTNPTNGASVDSRNLTVTVLDQGNLSPPGRPLLAQVSSTGGCIGLELGLPTYLGGWYIGTSIMWHIRVGTGFSYTFEKSDYVVSSISRIDACGLDLNTSYTISAALRTDSGTSESRIIDGFTQALSTPTQVLELLASPVTSGYAQLSWKAPFDTGGMPITTYEITVLNRATNEQRIIQVPGSNLTVAISFLLASTGYMFTVQAVNEGGLVGPDTRTSVWTDSGSLPKQPPVPELISATGGALRVRVLAPVDCGGSFLMHYAVNVARHTGGILAYRQYELGTVQSPSYDSNVANISIYGLLSNSEYFITVSVENTQGWSWISEEKIYKTTGPTPVSGIPAPIVALEDPGELTLQWNSPLDSGGLGIVGYSIQSRHKYPNGSWSVPEIVYDVRTSLVRTALIMNIVANTEYVFSVSGYNFRTLCRPDENITPSDELHITTQSASVPSQPKNFRMVHVTGGSITLVWDPPRSSGGEALLWYLIKGGVKYSQLEAMANVSATMNSLTLYGFDASTFYEFAIAGENSRGCGLYSPSLYVSTGSVSAPGPPKSLHQIPVASGGIIRLAWEAPKDSGGVKIQQYNILRDDNVVSVVIAVNGTTTFQDQNNILANKDYNYSVFASNDVATSTNPATITAHSGVASVPGAPSATIEAGSGFIRLELIPSPDSGGIPFLLFDLTVMRGSVPVDSYNTTRSVFTVTGLYADVLYAVLIQTVNARGKSKTTTLTTSTTAATIPDKMSLPRLVNVTGGRLQFEVLPPPNFGGRGVVEYRFYVNETLNEAIRNSETAYDVVGLTALTFYAVAVSATNVVGEGEQSDSLIVTTDTVTAPGQVWSLKLISKTYEAIEVEWMMPYDTGGNVTAVQFDVEINSSTSDRNLVISTTNRVALSGLEPATLYTIQVRAFNLIGEGPWCTSISVTTDPVSPGVIDFEKDAVDVLEDAGSITLTLIRSMGGYMPATCTFTTVDGTAIAGDHYVQTSGQVNFSRGTNSQQITIPIIDNGITNDPDQYFSVSIEEYDNESGAIGEISWVNVTITDDGDAGVVAFEQALYTVSESVSTLTVTIVRSGKFSGSGTFAIKPVDADNGAIEGVDFKIPSELVILSDQETQSSFNITIINDSTYQERKLFRLKLDVVSGRVAIADPAAFLTIEILDDGDASPPGLPTSVQVIAVSGGMINLLWVAPEYLGAKNPGELSYSVRVVEVQSGSTWEQSIKALNLLIPQLKSRAAYGFSVAAKTAFFLGEYTSSVPTLMKEPTPPSSPMGVRVLSQTGGMVTLSWSPPFDSGGVDITSYRVNISTSADNKTLGNYITVRNTISIGKLDPVTNYCATVESINSYQYVGEASTTVSFTTTSASMPGKPTSLVITKATGGALLVEMAPPLDTGGAPILYFTLFMTSAQYPTVFRQVYQGATSSFYATRLLYSTTYKFQYKVTTKVGMSELSDIFVAATKFLTLPDEAQNLAIVSRTGGSVTLSWTQPVDFGGTDITAYDVAFFLGYEVKSQFQQRISGVSVNATLVTAKVVGLQANSTYGFSVSGVNDVSVCEDPSAIRSRTILYSRTNPAVSLPDTPRGLSVVFVTSGTQTIQWIASEDAGGGSFVAYILYSDTDTVLYNGTSTTFTRGSLVKSTVYGYTVCAWNSAGSGVQSSRIFARTKTDIVAPSQPLNLAQTSHSGGSIGLTWQTPLDSGGDTISGYKLFRNGTWRADIVADSATMTYLDDQGLAALQYYVYTIRATNSIGLGAVSEVLIASTASATVPSAPTRLDVFAKGGNLSATWSPAANSGGMPLTFFRLVVKDDTGVVLDEVTATTQVSYITYGIRANTTYTVLLTSGNEIGESSATTQTIMNGAAVRPATPQVPEQHLEMTGLARWMIVLKLYFPIDNGGAPLKGLNLYQNGSRIRTVDATSQTEPGDTTIRFTLVEIGPLHAGFTYHFSTSALSSVETIGEGGRSDTVKIVMDPANLPSAPNNLRVVLRTAFSVFFEWDKSDDKGGDDVVYEIAFNNLNTSEPGQVETNTTAVEVSKLIPGNDYLFRVRARNSAGTSDWTSDLPAQTDVTQRGVITYKLASSTVFENVTSVTVQLLRVNGSSSTITCKYSNTSGTAIYGRDYSLPPDSEHSFTFVGELIEKSFDVQIINNDIYEPIPRTIGLTLTDTTPDRSDPFPPTPIIVIIVDDGDAGMISFVVTEVTVLENARIVSLPLQREYGKSTAVSVQILVYTGLTSTTQPDIGFRLPSTTVDFVDGQTSSSASIVIKDNDVYDFPYLCFYLTLEIAAGAARIGTNNVIKVVVQDDGDRSMPGAMKAPTLDKATGGMLRLKWEPPVNVGGQNVWITGYNVSIRTVKGTTWIITPTNATVIPFGGLNVLTEYNFSISAINSIGRGVDSSSVTFSTTKLTAPGPPEHIALLNRTGGLLTVAVAPPSDSGGASITGYVVHLAEQGSDFKMAYNGTGHLSSIIPVSVTKPNTAYIIRAQAINVVGVGEMSEPFSFESGPLSRPGPPRLPAIQSSRTGGAIKLDLLPPLDTGGHENISYMIYYRKQGLRERFRQAYYVANGLKITIFRLGADTTYDMVAVSHLEDSANVITWGRISVSDSRITLSDNVATEIVKSGYFDFGGYLFEVDTTQVQSNNTIAYSASLSTDFGAIAASSLQNGDEYDVFVRGPYSDVANYTTVAPTRPGMPPEPDLDYATGGALHIRISWPDDTGGIPITGYEFYINNKTVEGTLYHYISQGDFELKVTVEIGGLAPENNYSFYYIPLNDASACAGDDEDIPKQVIFSTDVASKPMPIQLIRSTGATGGGIHVEVKPPNDRGSDQNLTYQIYMSLSRSIPIWTRIYNDKDISYWQTKLQKVTEYLFMASCMNKVGYSSNSSIYPLRTTLISAPGPPGDLTLINATGGMIKISWKSPDDDGGSPIAYYSIHAQDTSGNPELALESLLPEISFGGLLANRVYEFKVFAGNSLGIGSDASVKRFSTTLPTPPSLPGDPVVLQSSGGSATLAIQVPNDTGGVNIDDLVCTVYENGFKVPVDAVRRLQNMPITVSRTRRLATMEVAADGGGFIYLQAGGLLPSTAYSFTIQISNDVGVSDTTNGIATATSVATVPGAPDPPTITLATGGALTLSWTDPVDTGGVPLTSYHLSMARLGEEVGSCEGMIRTCTVGDLLSITDYTVTIFAYNTVGVSPPSEEVTFTTEPTSLPLAPQDVHVAELSNTSVTIHWDPCIDFGGGYVDTYRLNIVQISNPSVTFSGITPVDEQILTIENLTPQTEYTATVRAVTGAGESGEASKIIFFRTPLYAHQPSPPQVGCHSRKVANVFWEAEDDAVSYRLFRDGEFYVDNGEDITYEDEIVLGKTYIYQVQVIRFDGSISALSETTTFTAMTPVSSGFDCVGNKGHIHWHDYKNLDSETWTITPQNQAGVLISFSLFWLECDHDSLTISVTKGGVTKQLWKGGCHRKGDFVVSTGPGLDSVALSFTSDGSVAYEGMALHYETVDASDAVESVSAPCPLSPTGFCSLNGACRKGTCSCFSGFIGESCTNAVICPEDLTTCTSTTCDPVCLHSQNDVIVVSENGDDTQGTGELMDTSTSGTDPKAVKSLRRALELATSGQTILLYPGIYTGVDNCGVTVSTASLLIRGLRGPIPTIVDCKNILRGLIIISDAAPNRLEGFRIQNTLASTDGGAIKVTDTAVEMKNMVITNANSRQNGGAIYAYQSQLTFTNVEITKCSAAKGGAIFLDNSDLILDDSIITLSSASEGGGIYAQNSVSVSGDKDSNLWQNHASINGGGLCISGSFTGTTLNVLENTALVGAGLTATSGSSTLSGMKVIGNRATNHGGGIAMLNSANLVLQNSTIQTNHADRNGGGVYILSNGSFENTLASEISNCTAASGGGFYTGDWSRPTVRNLRVVSSSATTSGGCAAFSCSSATVTNPSFEKCDAAIGGGVYVDAGSKVLLLQASIAECTATNGAGMYIGSSSVIGGSDVSSVVRDSHADSAAGGVYITGFHSSIEFFDVQNCSASIGGGVVAQEASSATMKSVQVVNNKATTSGGGLHAQNSTIQVEPVTVSSNRAVVGGGVYAIDSSLSGIITVDQNNGERGGGVATSGISLLEGATISANTASQRGGGVSVETGLFSLRSTIIQSCSVPQGVGGGISIVDADVKHYALKIESCASIRGGGIYVNSSSFYQYPTEESTGTSLNAASLTKNRAVEYGGSVFVDGEETTVSDLVITESHAPFGGGLAAQDATSCVVLNADISYSSASTSGGGLLFGSGTSCVIRDSWVMNNQARESGGGVMIFEATLYHSNVDISNNVAPTAGGVYLNSVLYSASLLSWDDGATQRSRIDANIIEPIGGNGANVVMNCTSNCTLSGCVISGANLQFGQGAGVFVLGRGNAVISNSLVANNSAIKGGGIAVSDAEKTVLENVGFIGNIATDSGGGLWAESSAFLPEVDLMSCVFYNNSAKTSGGAISLYGVYLYSSVLLVMENHAGNSESGIGGGLFSDKRVNPDRPSSVMADTWLFLSNDAPVGGSIAGVKSSEISLLDANITRDTGRFFTGTWPHLFSKLVGFEHVEGRAQNKVEVQKGDLVYLSDRDSVLELLSSFATQGLAAAGGGIYINANAFFYSQDSEISSNTANERGGSVCLSNSAQAYFTSVKVILSDSKTSGGGIYVESSSKLYAENSNISDNFADDSGGGIFIDTGDKNAVTLNGSFIERNFAHGEGCGVFVGREAILAGYKSQFIGNGGVTTSGKNEGGGAISCVDGIVKLTSCTFINNTALVGGAIHFDRGGSAAIMSSVFEGNTADQNGGAIATSVKAKVTIALQTLFENNVAHFGGAMAVSGTSTFILTSVDFRSNRASEVGGALFITDQAKVTMKAGELAGNIAVFGGALYSDDHSSTSVSDAKFIRNSAFTRGGAIYYQSIDNATITRITCKENTAPSGGCIFWVSEDEDLTPTYPCTSCTMEFNEVYDIATNTRDVQVMWWPENMTSGVPILEPPDEESIRAIKTRNESLERKMHVWPRLKAVDLYGQVEVLDNQTECMVSDGLCSEQTERLLFEPRALIRSAGGVISYRGASFTAANRTPEEGIYTTDISCTLPRSERRFFVQSVKLLPCQPGYSVNQGVCERCPKNMYSLDGLKCFDCPSGAKCNMNVRRGTDTIAEELGTVSPRTEEGYYLFSAPATKQESSCNKPSLWKDEDPCKNLALENPTKNLSDMIYECSNLNDFNVYWSADRLFSCLSGKSFYTCDVEGACQADVTVQMLAHAAAVSTVSCTSGYDLAICSVCADGYKRARDNSCLPCNEANAEVRASIKWQNFVIPVLLVLALIGGVFSVRFYLRDLTEIGLLAKAEADRRLKAPDSKKGGHIALRAGAKYRRQSMAVVGRVDQVKNKITAFFKTYQSRNVKMVFGVDVSPPPRTFPVNPSKFKIFIGFFQIFGNFQSSFVVKWSSNVQDVMNISQKFNLDLVAIAGIDCVVTKNFYFEFTVTVILVVLALTVITAYFYAGMRSYRSKLQLIPRNCLRCGLPVLESEVIQNDDESFNPLRLLRSWWRTYNFYKRSGSSSPVEAAKGGPENEGTAALSTLKETRALKRKFGMSQVRTPYLGLFRSVHAKCPTKRHKLSGAMLDRTIRSNLRVWQARVKLRMNYLTYRNKCLKLYCWIALFLYPSVSKTILTVYNCQEVGDVFYLVADRRLICYNAQWAVFGMIATIGVIVWVVGIPFFFGLLIWLAQDRGVAARIKLLRKPQMRMQRHKWLKEVEEQQTADGRFVRDMKNIEVQDEELTKYMKRKNLTDSTVQARLGFIYAEYTHDYWWFEVVDLSRKLFLSGVIVFVENGSVEQVLLALAVCLTTMWFLLYFQPYDGYSDNLIASITQLQLFFTLWLGVMIRLNDLNVESLINVQLLSFLLVGTCIAVTMFGISMIIGEGLAESRRIFAETTAQRKKQVQKEVRKRWFQAYNYAAYEAQMLRYGGQLSFDNVSVPAMLEAFRRTKLNEEEDPEYASMMPKIEEGDMDESIIESHPEYTTSRVNAGR
ncbi:hypothetical protein L914_15837 [Phytophthora nicotianae]|uniref:Fibronectin type-III domain-containing protein n=1 Tax=Phytophthora nicotianae TaxID=4792 RepID=W2MMS1_PHYNI|nr:hypothetical protein L914_15837 [Phytophthora nicotianae]